MTRREFLLQAFLHECYRYAAWVFSVFSVERDNAIQNYIEPMDYQLAINEGRYVYWLNNQWNEITDAGPVTEPLWFVEEGIEIKNQDELLQPHDTFPFVTRVGTLFVNYYCLGSVFKRRIPYQDGSISISKLESIVASKLIDRKPHEPIIPEAIYPEEAKLFSSACTSLGGFATIANPSATKYTMVPTPGIQELRAKLLEQNKDKLHDPAVIAAIEKELVEYDKAFQAQDPEGGFYINAKAFNVSRKKLYVMHGLEQPEVSDGKTTLITNSLSEGWDPTKLPAMIDSLRDGSYNRGAMTALGGEAVKFIFRIFATTKITEEDCKSTLGIPTLLTKENSKTYMGNTIILANKTQVKLNEKNISSYIGKQVLVRSPGFCKTGNANFCMACLGESLRGSENALAALASEVGSKMLAIFMAKMHGTALVTVPWDIKDTLN